MILCVCDNASYFSPFLFLLWKKSVCKKNDSWAFLFSRLLCQIVQAIIDYQLWCHHSSLFTFSLGDIPLLAWLLVSLSLLLVVVVNEVVKLHEIRYSSHKTKLKWENIQNKWQTGDNKEMFIARYNLFTMVTLQGACSLPEETEAAVWDKARYELSILMFVSSQSWKSRGGRTPPTLQPRGTAISRRSTTKCNDGGLRSADFWALGATFLK